MKIAGRSDFRLTFEEQFPWPGRAEGEPLVLRFKSLPLNWADTLRKAIPEPPKQYDGFLRDQRGRFVNDETGKPIPRESEDPAYVASKAIIAKLHTVYSFYKALEAGQIEFETGELDNAKAFAEALLGEMSLAGLTDWDIQRMQRVQLRAMGMTQDEIERMQKDFLSQTLNTRR